MVDGDDPLLTIWFIGIQAERWEFGAAQEQWAPESGQADSDLAVPKEGGRCAVGVGG